MTILDYFDRDGKEEADTCPSCGALLGIEVPKIGCEDPDGCGQLEEFISYEESAEIDFDE